MSLYLIKRGPRPAYHRAPWYPVVVCDNGFVAGWERGGTIDGAWVWEHDPGGPAAGWLFLRWRGLNIDYRHGHSCRLPDGTQTGYHHEHVRSGRATWKLLSGARWWSTSPLPPWLADRGVLAVEDDFSQECILERESWAREAGRKRKLPEGEDPRGCLPPAVEAKWRCGRRTKGGAA